MLVQMTIAVAGREVETVEREIRGTPAEREELAHACGREVGRVVNEQALSERAASADARHPHCCGRSMESKG